MLKLDSVSNGLVEVQGKTAALQKGSAAVFRACALNVRQIFECFSRSHSCNLLKAMICCRRYETSYRTWRTKFSSSFCAAMKAHLPRYGCRQL